MPKKKKVRINHKRVLKRLFAFAAVASLTWGVWKIMDNLFWPDNPITGASVVIAGALIYLFLDDFHLKELE
jgi:hypothetical protein